MGGEGAGHGRARAGARGARLGSVPAGARGPPGPRPNLRGPRKESGGAQLSGTRSGVVPGPRQGALLSAPRGLHSPGAHCVQRAERWGEQT